MRKPFEAGRRKEQWTEMLTGIFLSHTINPSNRTLVETMFFHFIFTSLRGKYCLINNAIIPKNCCAIHFRAVLVIMACGSLTDLKSTCGDIPYILLNSTIPNYIWY